MIVYVNLGIFAKLEWNLETLISGAPRAHVAREKDFSSHFYLICHERAKNGTLSDC